jgi:hypothetical protein
VKRLRTSALVLLGAALAACSDGGAPVSPSAPIAARAGSAADPGLPVLPTLQTSAEPKNVPGALQRFDITLRFVVPPSDAQRAAFETAAGRWQRIIVGDKPAVAGTIPAGACGLPGVPSFTGTIDDIMIDVVLVPIDGPGGILGASGPCLVRVSDWLPAYGIMFFDTADLDFLGQVGLLNNVVTHEMGHVLGFGTLWDFQRSLLAGGGTSDPLFTGHDANVHYNTLHTSGEIPVENIGGPGTADAHWRESVFGNELMTGFIGLGTSPLSSVSTAAMKDLGYVVAPVGEAYSLPQPSAGASAAAQPAAGAGALTATQSLNVIPAEQLLHPLGAIR